MQPTNQRLWAPLIPIAVANGLSPSVVVMNVLVVGGSGLLGAEVVRQAVAAHQQVTATYFAHPVEVVGAAWHALDITDRERTADLLTALRPDVVVNAAYQPADWAVTADGAALVALAAAAVGARLVHVSSDAVFSGAATPYDETALPDPITAYGAAKTAAETAIKAISPTAVIARTSLIIGNGDSDQERLVHGLATGERTGVLFTDDVRCPVHVTDLAAALLELAWSEHAGVHHVAGPDAISRYEMGTLIALRDGLDPHNLPAGRRCATNLPGPIDVRLNSVTTQRRLRTRLRGARDFLRPITSSPSHGRSPGRLEGSG